MAVKLKPCPVCGKPPNEVELDGPAPFEIVCDRQPLYRARRPRPAHAVMAIALTKRGVIAAWNRRAS